MNLVVFEDSGVRNLHPITLSRPAYAINCAGYRLIDLLSGVGEHVVGVVRSYLERIQVCDFPQLSSQLDQQLDWTLLVNARMAPTLSNLRHLESLMGTRLPELDDQPGPVVVRQGWAIAAAVIQTDLLTRQPVESWSSWIESLPNGSGAEVREGQFRLFDYPHCVVAENLDAFERNLEHRISQQTYEERQAGVFFGEGVKLNSQVAFDSSTGPIVIDDGVSIGPFSFFRGPVYVGPRSRISEHASIKDGVSISHTCKIGGEVEGTIMEPYTNKQHHGFLGHSYLGSWINLGAGTCNSDLKNTYGTVNMEYHGQKVSTGLQFVGCIMGDYAKTAINTSIFTGKTIGVASMVYGFATTNVPSFVNYARTFGEYGGLPPEVVVTTQKRMFERRNVEQRPCDIQLLHDIHEITACERPDGLSGKPLAL